MLQYSSNLSGVLEKKKRVIFFAIGCLFTIALGYGQTQQGYIIKVEVDKIYLDLHAPDVKVSDVVSVYSEDGYITHPVTNQKIKTEGELIGRIEITSVYETYSIGKILPGVSKALKEGMSVKKEPTAEKVGTPIIIETERPREAVSHFSAKDGGKPTVVITSAQVNDVVGSVGYFGGYVSDMLMEQLLRGNQVQLLDRSALNAQMDELELVGAYIDPETAIQRGKIIGARYIIQVTMQRPDVVNVRTGVPLASIMGAAQSISNKNLYAQYTSNAQKATLKAEVRISARVVDLETGVVNFMSSANGKAQGKSQLGLEYGALGGLELNGGADGFRQTITGKAVQSAFISIGRNMNGYFAGNIDKKFVGSFGSGTGYGNELYARGNNLYLGVEKLNKESAQMTFEDYPDLYFKYRKAKRNLGWSTTLFITSGIGTLGGIWWTLYEANRSLYISRDGSRYGREPQYAGPLLLTPTFVGGCIFGGMNLRKNGRSQLRNIVNEYNAQSDFSQASLSLFTTGNGLGLRLTF